MPSKIHVDVKKESSKCSFSPEAVILTQKKIIDLGVVLEIFPECSFLQVEALMKDLFHSRGKPVQLQPERK